MAPSDSVPQPRRQAVATTIALLALILHASTMGQSNHLFSPIEPRGVRAVSATLPDQSTVRQRLVSIDFNILTATRAAAVLQTVPTTLTLNLFDDVEFTAIVESTRPTSSGYSLLGRIQQMDLATMALVVNGEVVVGTVRTAEATYRIGTAGKGVYRITQLDPSKERRGGEPVIVAPPIREGTPIPR